MTVSLMIRKHGRVRVDSRHAHGKTVDHKVIVERLENIPAYERVVDTRIPVTLQVRQLMLANVHHLDCLISPGGNASTGCFVVLASH